MEHRLTSYEKALNGAPLPESASWWQRFQYGRGLREMARISTYEAEENTRTLRAFEAITNQAQGLNKPIFEIIRSAAEIPQPTHRTPLKGYTMATHKGERAHHWVASLSFGNTPIDPEGKFHTPVTKPLGTTYLDSLDWAHYGFAAPVNTVTIHAQAHITSEGAFTFPTSSLVINRLDYNPDTLELDDSDTFTGSLQLEIDEQGAVKSVQRTSSSYTGFSEVEHSRINIASLLTEIKSAVDDTVLTYRQD